jgi:hypothetical protein
LVLFIGVPHSMLELGFSSLTAGLISLYSPVVYAGRRRAAIFVAVLVLVNGRL